VWVVWVISAFVAATVGAASDRACCTPTPNDGGGPDRGTAPLRAKIGTGHVLTGVVLSPSCAPIAGARVSFWQSNRKGVYTAAGRGAVRTNRLGRFRFEGPMPTAYAGRAAPHPHQSRGT
jgi:protocatechuate 3,4-dioxygenase beta subunit